MPKPLPPDIQGFIKQHAPPTHELVWLRCIQTAPAEEIERPPYISNLLGGRKPPIPRDLRLRLYDLDTKEDGWDVRLMGTGHDIAPSDLFTLLGHVEKGADRLVRPFLILNHNTLSFDRVYEDVSDAGGKLQTEIRYKRSLSFWMPGTLPNRLLYLRHTLAGFYTPALTPPHLVRKNMILTALLGAWVLLLLWLAPGGGWQSIWEQTLVHPWLAVLWIPVAALIVLVSVLLFALPLIIIGAGITYLGIRIVRAIQEPPRFRMANKDYTFSELCGWSNVTDWWRNTYTDQTYLYEEIMQRLHWYARANPDEDRGFVIKKVRGLGDKGKLADTPQLACPQAGRLKAS